MTARKKTAEQAADAAAQTSEDSVREYLRQNPDFFERYPDLLDHLHITHSAGGAVSLVEKQVSVLRERNVEIRKRLNSLTGNARENDRLYELTRQLVLALLEANSLESLAGTFTRGLREDFGVEHVSMILFGDPEQASKHCRVETAENARVEIGALIKGHTPVCGTLRREELSYLFPGAGDIGSAAVVPLLRDGELGVIAVGSDDPHHYGPNMGTLFLSHLGDVIVRLLPRLTDGGDGQD